MLQPQAARRIAVVGAGWAGLSSARLLADAGYPVEVFEAAPQAGGRARAVEVPLAGGRARVDNGQHLLIGAYRAVRTLLAQYAGSHGHALQPAGFHIAGYHAGHPARHHAAHHAAHPAGSYAGYHAGHHAGHLATRPIRLAQSPGVEALQGRLSALPILAQSAGAQAALVALRQASWLLGSRRVPLAWMAGLRKLLRATVHRPPAPGEALGSYVHSLRLAHDLRHGFLAALAESALNVNLEHACALRFALVVREAFGGMSQDAAHFLHPQGDLSRLLPEALIAGKAPGGPPLRIRYRARVDELLRSDAPPAGERNWWLRVHGEPTLLGPFHHVVLALDPASLRRLASDQIQRRQAYPTASGAKDDQTLRRLKAALASLPPARGIFTRWLALRGAPPSLPVLALPVLAQPVPGSPVPGSPVPGSPVPPPTSRTGETGHSASAWVFPRPGGRGLAPESAPRASSAGFDCLAGLVVSAVDDREAAARIALRTCSDLGLDVVDHFDIEERRAATPSLAGLEWPAFDLCGSEGLWLAGDWVGDGSGSALPATLESAVRSALAVARAIQTA